MSDINRSNATATTGQSGQTSTYGQSGQSQQGFTDNVRQRAIDTYDSAKDSASQAGRRANETISEAPFIALGAGIAAGALIAALLPTSRREREMLGPYGSRVSDAARQAAAEAKRTGSDKLRELGLSPDTLADKAGEAAKATAQAAASTFRGEAKSDSSGSSSARGTAGSNSGTGSSATSQTSGVGGSSGASRTGGGQ